MFLELSTTNTKQNQPLMNKTLINPQQMIMNFRLFQSFQKTEQDQRFKFNRVATIDVHFVSYLMEEEIIEVYQLEK